jgi:sugar O-acyltransferase (sialic acid O-acetyltransferase NeuD family)
MGSTFPVESARPIVVFGAGGHGKVVADILLAAGERVGGFIDEKSPVGSHVFGLPVVGNATWLEGNRARVALGIGDNDARARVAELCFAAKAELVAAIHPRAVVAASATIEAGAVVMALAVVNPDAVIRQGAIVNTGAIIEHDCVVERFAHISPNATLAGGCRVGAFAHLGVGASMLPGTSVGERTVVGGGALVARDIQSDAVARGVPARVSRAT